MNTNLLRSWLGLPPGPWPPSDPELLGLGDGPFDLALAERKALEQMARLRSHQLVHPELVTEGMNRIAQALLGVMSSSAPVKSAPKLIAAPPEPVLATPQVPPSLAASANVLLEAPIQEAEPIIVSAELVEPHVTAPSLPIPHELPPEQTRSKKVESPWFPDAVEVPIPHLEYGRDFSDKRDAYSQIAAYRGLLRAWNTLGQSIVDPKKRVTDAGDIYQFILGLLEYRDALRHRAISQRFVAHTAPMLTILLEQPLALAVFRSLIPSQRKLLAQEWQRSRAQFQARITGLRESLSQLAEPRPRITSNGIGHFFTANPEWSLIALSVLVVGVAAFKWIVRP